MATLYVRNFPDELYEQLRSAAQDDGRSIGQQASILLRGALVERDDRKREMQRVMVQTPSFRERFVERAEAIVLRAQEICREVGSPEVTPAHVMLAMLEDDVLRPALERKGITADSVRAVLPDGPPRKGPAPVSAETRRMLETAVLQSLGL